MLNNQFYVFLLVILVLGKLFAQPLPEKYTLPPASPTQSPSDVNIAQPENVLVVYNRNSQISTDVKNYYVSARNIPSINVVKDDDGAFG